MANVMEAIARLDQEDQDMIMLGVRIPAQVSRTLDSLAEQQGTKKSALVRRAILEYLKQYETEAIPA